MRNVNLSFENIDEIESSVENIENILISSFEKTNAIHKISKKNNQV